MDHIEEYIYNCEGEQREILLQVHQLLLSYPHVVAKYKYKTPFYYRKSWICYLLANKNGSVDLSFTRALEFADENKKLDFRDRKMVGSICLSKLTDINEDVMLLIQEALLIDDTVPYTKKWFGKDKK
ncbi:DUF1801 domain-containing protein [Marinifilum caeruleilacunae]|jgi:hypothetical protein|uniref:DUF1801 domain-containing protein n=1 Tax=Marinifilum caeruleilacunae TaxID=2499076 RepID=A0ABX1WRW9_9BACT|nr:DUF1801 domain-containing protein [Marinifilum caeruleilacunae]NOU58747.1 DUF1801 domain-containing protein [Marinifilum caeruleilacunae]